MDINLFYDPQFLQYTPTDQEWEEKQIIEDYVFDSFEYEISKFKNFPRRLFQYYGAKHDSIEEDDETRCHLLDCFLIAAVDTLNFYGYSIDENDIVTANLNENAVADFTANFIFNLREFNRYN